MKKYKFIPYDKNLVSRAREFRKGTTEAEQKFWLEILKAEKLSGLKFTRQKPIGSFILDFYCAKLKLGIEIDGEVHGFQKIRDRERDNVLREKFEIRILRYKNSDVLENLEKLKKDLARQLFPPDKGEYKGV